MASQLTFALVLAIALASAAGYGMPGDAPAFAAARPEHHPAPRAGSPTPVCHYRVLNSYPHDPDAFTQGLVIDDGELFESTGLWGESSLRRVELETGEVLQIRPLDPEYFGEGLAAHGGRLIQLTYVTYLGFIYDRDTFGVLGTFDYPTQGWGLTTDGNLLIMTDGSSTLRFWHPDTFEEIGRVEVRDEHGPITWLNELEWIDGHVWANVLYSTRIARIDPLSGRVTSWVELAGLGPDPLPGPLNGIAHDPVAGRLVVTGKLWPTLYEIELVDCLDLLVFSSGFERGDLSGWE